MPTLTADTKNKGSVDRGRPSRTELLVSGMTCQNCARHVREALQDVPGVAQAEINLDKGEAVVRWKPEAQPDFRSLAQALGEAGYKAAEPHAQGKAPSKWSPLAGWHFNVAFGLAVTLPLVILEWGFGAGMERWYQWLSFFLVLPLQTFGGLRFYQGAWAQLKKGQSNMDTLVALGSTTAFLYSVWGLLAGWHSHLFFMDSAAIITLVSLGHFFESKASAQAASSLRALLNLAPETARRLSACGTEEIVPVADLDYDDRVLLKPGDRIPTDGEVIEGISSVDESMLTGESLPVDKTPGTKVYAGTINDSRLLTFRVTAHGDETALANIIRVVQQAQSSRASIQRLGDKVSSIFVPNVVTIAIATALWWWLGNESARAAHAWLSQFLWKTNFPTDALSSAIFHAAAVLIIACPCAMGLATPVAIMAGTNVAARRGILIRDGAALEKTGTITAILFDKTGTLTEGKVSVGGFEELRQIPGLDSKALAASLSAKSNHPLSKAIATAGDRTQSLENWQELSGSGLQASLPDGHGLLRLGNFRWLSTAGVETGAGHDFFERWTRQGATVVGLALNSELIAAIALKDQLKANAREVVQSLIQKGQKVYLVTGDNRQTAQAIGDQVGIAADHIHAEVRPEGKVEVIRQLQAAGERVAFAGDGINDAPALEQADLGIALMNASDVARESADIILLKAELEAIPESLGLTQATLRTIKQNLFWAFFYNAAGVPLAALGFLSPIFSAFAMGMSDLIVIGNALRLRYWRPK